MVSGIITISRMMNGTERSTLTMAPSTALPNRLASSPRSPVR
jgi:hypothetical protein